MAMRLQLPLLCCCLIVLSSPCASVRASAQCAENNYIHDGAPSAQLDCQPLRTLKQVSPNDMAAVDRALVEDRQADLAAAAHFYGFDLARGGWSFQQAISPLLRKHLVLIYSNADPARKASRFTAVVPLASQEKIQIIPAFAQGLLPMEPHWKSANTYAVFNRLLRDEHSLAPITDESAWLDYGVLYLGLAGSLPIVPTETDSIKANWDLTRRRATTPVITVYRNGSAVVTFSDTANEDRAASWKLIFDKRGMITKAERREQAPATVNIMKTVGTREALVDTRR